MDTIAEHLRPLASKVTVPRSIPGMVTKRMLTMTFAEGLPLLQLKDRVHDMPKWKRDKVGRCPVCMSACTMLYTVHKLR